MSPAFIKVSRIVNGIWAFLSFVCGAMNYAIGRHGDGDFYSIVAGMAVALLVYRIYFTKW